MPHRAPAMGDVMSYANIDNRFDQHDKTLFVLEHEDGLAAIGLWTLALSHCHAVAREQVFDQARTGPAANGARTTQPLGFISRGMVCRLVGKRGPDLAAILATPLPDGRTGLWEEAPGGWVFHEFPGWQQVELWRAARESGRRGGQASASARAAKAAGQEGLFEEPSSNPSRDAEGSLNPGTSTSTSTSTQTPNAGAFDEFWAIYPRKTDKKDARAKFAKALATVTLDVLLAGARRYRDDPNRVDQYTKYPGTWLSHGCWDDDPIPPRDGPPGSGGATIVDDDGRESEWLT